MMKATLTKEKRERGTHFEAKILFAKKKKIGHKKFKGSGDISEKKSLARK